MIETKLTRLQVKQIVSGLHYNNWWVVDICWLSGGLRMMWSDNITVNILSWFVSHILDSVEATGCVPWLFTTFYGRPNHAMGKFSWEFLFKLYTLANGPWLLARDFNEIMRSQEKLGVEIEILGQYITSEMFWTNVL